MLIDRVMSFAADPHGLLGYSDDDPGAFDPETAASIRILQRQGFIERRERTVNIEASSYGGNWTELQRTGPTTIVTWHLTEAGRAHWLHVRSATAPSRGARSGATSRATIGPSPPLVCYPPSIHDLPPLEPFAL